MGTWGVGPFANDDAADLLGELGELDPQQQQDRVAQALQLPSDGYVESPEASEAVAAAALVAMRHGYAPPQEDAEDAASLQFESTPQLRSAAAAALRRVQAKDSEWAELWEEAGASDEVARVVAEIDQHLS